MKDHETLEIIKARLQAFKGGRIPLSQIVGELEALQDNLESAEEDWIERFNKERFALEEINAIRLDEEYSGSDEYDLLIEETVSRLRSLIETFPGFVV